MPISSYSSSATLPSTMPQPAYTQPTSPSNTPVRSATENSPLPAPST